jgi:DTW domain-containing protein YfiP
MKKLKLLLKNAEFVHFGYNLEIKSDPLKNQRQRKSKDPCEGCGLHKDLCICALIPKINIKTKLTLVIHKRELKRTTNTGQLAIKALTNSELKVMGEQNSPFELSSILDPEYENLLFYPSDEASELNPEFLKQFSKPIHLIVPDGNWRQASKVHYRNKNLTSLPRVKLNFNQHPEFFLRTETKENGMATLEAIALAMGLLEGEDVKNSLMKVFQAKLKNTLKGRGINNSDF